VKFRRPAAPCFAFIYRLFSPGYCTQVQYAREYNTIFCAFLANPPDKNNSSYALKLRGLKKIEKTKTNPPGKGKG